MELLEAPSSRLPFAFGKVFGSGVAYIHKAELGIGVSQRKLALNVLFDLGAERNLNGLTGSLQEPFEARV